MKTWKKTVSLLLMLLTFVMNKAVAQKDSSRMDKVMARMKNELQLNEEQTVKVRDILSTQGKKAREIRQANQGNREAAREALKQNARQTDDLMKGVLNAEQMKRYHALRKQMREERKARRGNRPAPGAPPAAPAPDEDDIF